MIVAGRKDEVVLKAVLKRWQELGIRPIIFEINRRGSDSIVVREGAMQARIRAREFKHFLCLWDHKDSGKGNEPPSQVQDELQEHLNRRRLQNREKALVIDPELEIWLWQDKKAIARVLGISQKQLARCLNRWQSANFPKRTLEQILSKFPKEALEEVCQEAREKLTAALYQRIAHTADLSLWASEQGFQQLCQTLLNWFSAERSDKRCFGYC